jgi:hypothetical protein
MNVREENPELATRDEILALGRRRPAGSTSAMIALERALRIGETPTSMTPVDDIWAELDAFSPKRGEAR